jgi:putative ABC transport system permease protein
VLRRYKLAAALNVLGLSIAFTAFLVIMMQVDYDRGFDRMHRGADHIFRVEALMNDSVSWALINRPLSNLFFQSSPHILAGTITNPFSDGKIAFSTEINGEKHKYQEPFARVTPSYTEVFPFDMVEGLGNALEEPSKILIPQSMAKKLFGGEAATGQPVLIPGNDNTITIGGVYKDFPRNSSIRNVIYVAISPQENLNSWENWNYVGYIRVDAPENTDDLFENFKKNIDTSAFDGKMPFEGSFRFTSLPDLYYKTGVNYDQAPKSSRQTARILLAIAFLIVVIAGINYTNFSAALTPKRIRSINTQKVLGGSTAVIRMALITEGIVIGLVSYFLALGLVDFLHKTSFVSLVDADISLAMHPALVVGAAALAILTGLLAGLYPAYYVTSFPPALALKGNFGLSPKGRQLRNVLISLQFFTSFALIIGASFMFLQNDYMQNSPMGYDRDELIVTDLNNKLRDSRDAFSDRLTSFSGISDVTYSRALISGSDQYMGWGRDYHGTNIQFQCLPVDPSFLRVMGVTVTEGRDFRRDDENTRHGAFIFNETARIEYDLALNDRGIDSAEIVGFMSDVKFASFRTEVLPMAFFVWGTENWGKDSNFAYIKVRAGADLRAALTHVRTTLASFDDEASFDVRFFDDVINGLYVKEQKIGSLITIFSLVAIFIAIVGVFGLVIFDSEYRRKEISLRKVFGSTTWQILVLFNKGYIRILALSFALAAPVAWYLVARWLESFAYRTPMYWWVYAAAFALIFILTVATVTFQNWRAANMNPVEAIKMN